MILIIKPNLDNIYICKLLEVFFNNRVKPNIYELSRLKIPIY